MVISVIQKEEVMPEPLERVARALCSADGHPEDTMFETKPMWASYAGEAELVLRKLKAEVLVDALASVIENEQVPESVREKSRKALAQYRTGKVSGQVQPHC